MKVPFAPIVSNKPKIIALISGKDFSLNEGCNINYTQKIKPDKIDIFTDYTSKSAFPFSR